MRAGLISAMYMGEEMEAAPTPIPPMMRKMTKMPIVGGTAVPMAEIRNMTAPRIRTFFRPKRSLRAPAAPAPRAQPSRAQPVAQPSQLASSVKWALSGPIAPLITPVS